MQKKIPNNAVPDPEKVLEILGIPVLGTIGDDDEALGFKWKKKEVPSSAHESSDKSGGTKSSENTEPKK